MQPIHMGIVRSDYLLHEAEGEPLSMRQVEFNAIGCAFGPHSQIVGTLHKCVDTHSFTPFIKLVLGSCTISRGTLAHRHC